MPDPAHRQHRPPDRQRRRRAACAPRTRSPACCTATAWTPLSVSVDRRELRHRPVRRGRHEHGARPHGRRRRQRLPGDRQGPPAPPGAPHRHATSTSSQVNLDEEITVSVPLRLEGEATAVMQERRPRRPGRRHHRSRHHAAQHPGRVRHRHQRDGDGHGDPPRRRRRCRRASPPTGDPDIAVVTVLIDRAPSSRRSRLPTPRRAEGAGVPRAPRSRGRGRERSRRVRRSRRVIAATAAVASTGDAVKGGTPFDWLVVGLGNPASSTPARATTSARRSSTLLADAPRHGSSRVATTRSSASRASATSGSCSRSRSRT